jgi:3-dehydroquinate synthase
MELMSVDKKAEGGEVRYILLNGLGQAKIQTVDDDLVIQTLLANGVA